MFGTTLPTDARNSWPPIPGRGPARDTRRPLQYFIDEWQIGSLLAPPSPNRQKPGMDGLGKILRERARTLGLSDSEIARRLGLSQARYHNYVSDTAEPDLGTLVRICRVLGTSPDEVLLVAGEVAPRTESQVARERVASAASALEGEALAYTADLLEAMLAVQRGKARKPGAKPGARGKTREGAEHEPSIDVPGTGRRAAKQSGERE